MKGVAMSVAALSPVGHRVIRAPRGPERTCQGWIQEAALRMLMNNLDPEVAEDPDRLVVYGGSGKAARTWQAFDTIVATLRKLGNEETLLVQSGKPVGVIRTHAMAPRVLIATMNGAAYLGVDVNPARIERRLQTGYVDRLCSDLDEALQLVLEAKQQKRALSVGLVGNVAEVLPELVRRQIVPDVLTDQTS